MNLECETNLGDRLRSGSQRARVITESWFGTHAYCLACSSPNLQAAAPNRPVHDFTCPLCCQTYELKSSERINLRRVVDGSYATMLDRIRSRNAPLLILLQYSRGRERSEAVHTWSVQRVLGIHPVFLTDAIIEPRKPLSETARRAGWQGCNLRIERIPPDGIISVVEDGMAADPAVVRNQYESSRQLSQIDPDARGWTATVLNIVRRTGSRDIRIEQLYGYKPYLQEIFPSNQNIEAKIRQQLQVLRDLGYLKFKSRGEYEVMN